MLSFRSALALALVATTLLASAEELRESLAHIPQHNEARNISSGLVKATHNKALLFSELVSAPGAKWLRVHFDQSATLLGPGAVITLTSAKDGHVQRLDATGIQQWYFSSAYFNGDAVRVDVFGAEGAVASVAVSGVTVGDEVATDVEDKTLCDGYDGRVFATRPTVARYIIEGGGGCTIWLIDDENHCFLTAGHCGTSRGGVAQFNVPMSLSSGTVQHPSPEDQYSLDTDSVQFQNSGVGSDWKYVGAFPNADTGKEAYEAQGDWHRLLRENTDAPKSGDLVEHFGYGTAAFPDRSFSQVQKGTRQKIYSISGSAFRHRCDTTGGDSGSPVDYMPVMGKPDHDDGRWRGRSIAIHSHGGCTSSAASANGATFIPGNALLQDALSAPKGVCASRKVRKAAVDLSQN